MSRVPRQGLRSRQAATLTKLLTAGEEELRHVGHETLTVRTVAARAGVSPATAYTYLASKNHLFAELFLGYLVDDADHEPTGTDAVARVQSVTRRMALRLAEAPEMAAAVTPALLSSDPDVDRLRLRIGAEFVRRFESALGPDDHSRAGRDLDARLLRRPAAGRHGRPDLHRDGRPARRRRRDDPERPRMSTYSTG